MTLSRIRPRVVAAACLLSLASVAACTASATDEEAAASESELRSLSSSEILGEIPFGTSTDAAHSGTPKYRAYWFNAQAGDKLDIWVRSQNTDARAWLLDDGFRTLKWNNDANASNEAEDDATTTDSNITYAVPRTGKYYVAFRGQLGAAANFSVRVDRTSTQPPIDPPQAGNPWSCSGTPLSNADLVARIPTGADTVSLLPAGGLRYETRSRTCNQQTGCAPWGAVAPVSGNDGALANLSLTTTAGGALTLRIKSASDSDHSYTVNNGQVTGASHHTPKHESGAYEAVLTNTCFGSRIKVTLGTNGQGTWNEVEYGVRTGMPSEITRPVDVPSNPWECAGAPLSQSEILRRFPAGADTLSFLDPGARYETRSRTCSSLTGCAPWTAIQPVAGNDGALSVGTIQTTGANGLTLRIKSASDSDHSYGLSSGTFSGASHHTPNHASAPIAGSITAGCAGWRIQTKTAASGTGTWSETEYGYKGGFPAPVR